MSTIIQTVIVLLLSAFFSGMEIAFVSSSKLRFEIDKAEHNITSRLLSVFYAHPSNFITTMLVGNNIALVVYGMLMAQLLDIYVLQPFQIGDDGAIMLIVQTVISTLIVLVTGEFLPKTLFRINPNGTMRFFALPTMLFYIVLYPISKFTSALSKMLFRIFGIRMKKSQQEPTFTRVDLDYLIQSSMDDVKDDSEIEEEVKIFQNALDFGNTRIRDCIVPRTELDAVSVDTPLEVLRNHFIETGHSKIIVFREDIDDIVGYVHSSEMFRLKNGADWTQTIREVPIVPETMPAPRLMQDLMQKKRSLAVVVDEFGGTSGIVTLEDLVEEIFGDIKDEHDKEEYTAKRISDNEYMLSARLEIEKVNELFDLELPESDEYMTVGGLILHEYQSFPKLNEIVKFGAWEFKILKNTTTKIELVKLTVKPEL